MNRKTHIFLIIALMLFAIPSFSQTMEIKGKQIQKATTSNLGVVKVSDGLNIDVNGLLKANTNVNIDDSSYISVLSTLQGGINGLNTNGGFISGSVAITSAYTIKANDHVIIRVGQSDDDILVDIPNPSEYIGRELIISNNSVPLGSVTDGLGNIVFDGATVQLSATDILAGLANPYYARTTLNTSMIYSSITIRAVLVDGDAYWYTTSYSK